jgi:hypothetical protein
MGHAVADWKLGFKIKRVTIVAKDDVAGYVLIASLLRLRRLEFKIPS